MLFGYGLAVVAGFLLGPQPLWMTIVLVALWLAARIAFIGWPDSWMATVVATLFAIGICVRIVPRFAPSAKKWRNQSLVWIVAGLAVTSSMATAAIQRDRTTHAIQMESLILLAGLMFFMGGRIMAPAIGGHITRHGGHLENRVQPALEGVVLLLLLGALAGILGQSFLPRGLTGVMLMGAGVFAAARFIRWRLWLCADRPDLLILALGYAWLIVGMGLLGAACFAVVPMPIAIHSLTIGALGTLTVTIMARTRLLYRFRDANRAPEAHVAGLLMSGAALARIGWTAASLPSADGLLALSAALWTLACLLILFTLLRTLAPTGHMFLFD